MATTSTITIFLDSELWDEQKKELIRDLCDVLINHGHGASRADEPVAAVFCASAPSEENAALISIYLESDAMLVIPVDAEKRKLREEGEVHE